MPASQLSRQYIAKCVCVCARLRRLPRACAPRPCFYTHMRVLTPPPSPHIVSTTWQGRACVLRKDEARSEQVNLCCGWEVTQQHDGAGPRKRRGQGENARLKAKTKREEGKDGPVDGEKLARTHVPPCLHLGVRMLVCVHPSHAVCALCHEFGFTCRGYGHSRGTRGTRVCGGSQRRRRGRSLPAAAARSPSQPQRPVR